MTEQRLIDANYAKYALKFIPYIDYSQTDRVIDECPTVDAVPVVHGHWDCRNPQDHWEYRKYSCSNCGAGGYQTRYCSACGAKMYENEGEQEKEVKCKDCKNGIAESSCIWCYKHHMPCGENYHCSDGERKEGEQDDDKG